MPSEITLPPVATDYLNAKVASGEYASVTEALLDALLLLQTRDAQRERQLRAIDDALDAAAGRPTVPHEDVMAMVREKIQAKRRAEQPV
jgi:Arc/MetJ-type ribon-helix-helix transcriptional regulator